MNNKLVDLNNHLFEALERLNDDELIETNLDKEIERSRAITGVAKAIIENASVILEAQKQFNELGVVDKKEIPLLLQSGEN